MYLFAMVMWCHRDKRQLCCSLCTMSQGDSAHLLLPRGQTRRLLHTGHCIQMKEGTQKYCCETRLTACTHAQPALGFKGSSA